ncbi:MAG: divergent polysaccharide deacetylase family protein [Thermodesulfobacteriota bacterium]|nr:divergent polysaccharide deacetylase family protein [Thermodesulfobacteriota bacterium]
MNRRNFLLKSTGLLIVSFFGLNIFSKAFAIEKHQNHTVDQPRIALIIDDIGFSLSHARQFLNLGVPITFAILPRLVYSYDLALEIYDNGHEILLHQPMEPYNIDSFDPGPGALYVGDGADRIERIIEDNIAGVPYAVGVNNHMGSRFTEAYKEIREVLENVKKRGLFFVDSLTSSHSMAYRTARKLHMAATGRNIFLDNLHDESAIYDQLNKLKRHSIKYGHAVGIGHPFPQTVHTIRRFVKNIKDSDISLVHVSDVL